MGVNIITLSLNSISATLFLSIFAFLPKFGRTTNCDVENHLWWFLPSYFILVNVSFRVFLKDFPYQVAVRSAFLGFTFSLGMMISVAPCISQPSWHVFGWYMCILSMFHYSEFLMIGITNRPALSVDSFILNHSLEYGVAAVASWLEFFIEWWLFPGMKEWTLISAVGLALCIGGEVLRKLAMFTAKTNFNHVVQSQHEQGHKLVTHGVYSWFRHPSYVGWFYWSIGTQIMLLNPLCLVAYTLASWKFFHDRVWVEEVTLLNFFDEEYHEYKKRVRTGLPFIYGYKSEL